MISIKLKNNIDLTTQHKRELNHPLHTNYLNNKLNTLEKKFDLTQHFTTWLTSSFVSDLLNNGVDDLVVTSLVGHVETSDVTRVVYGHVNQEK